MNFQKVAMNRGKFILLVVIYLYCGHITMFAQNSLLKKMKGECTQIELKQHSFVVWARWPSVKPADCIESAKKELKDRKLFVPIYGDRPSFAIDSKELTKTTPLTKKCVQNLSDYDKDAVYYGAYIKDKYTYLVIGAVKPLSECDTLCRGRVLIFTNNGRLLQNIDLDLEDNTGFLFQLFPKDKSNAIDLRLISYSNIDKNAYIRFECKRFEKEKYYFVQKDVFYYNDPEWYPQKARIAQTDGPAIVREILLKDSKIRDPYPRANWKKLPPQFRNRVID